MSQNNSKKHKSDREQWREIQGESFAWDTEKGINRLKMMIIIP